ncbi:MAG: hypothetical protein R3C26_03870 [Calditrichia bacterium]
MRIFEQLLPALERENLPVILMMMGAVLLLLAVFRGGFVLYIAQLMMATAQKKPSNIYATGCFHTFKNYRWPTLPRCQKAICSSAAPAISKQCADLSTATSWK